MSRFISVGGAFLASPWRSRYTRASRLIPGVSEESMVASKFKTCTTDTMMEVVTIKKAMTQK